MSSWSASCRARRRLPALAVLLVLVGCSGAPPGPPDPDAPRGAALPSAGSPRPCAVAGFAPTERTDPRRGTRVVVYALPVALAPGRGGRVPVTLRRTLDLRPGVRATDGAAVDPRVLRRVGASFPDGSTGPLSETFYAELDLRPAPRPRRLVAYAVTRARPFDWTAEVCGPPTTADGTAATVGGTGLVVGRFRTGALDCDRPGGPPTAAGRQLLALCG